MKKMYDSFYEKTARERISALVDKGSFVEYLAPNSIATSPHLARLNMTGSFDDGVIIGQAKISQRPYLIFGFKPKEIINMDLFGCFLSCT